MKTESKDEELGAVKVEPEDAEFGATVGGATGQSLFDLNQVFSSAPANGSSHPLAIAI